METKERFCILNKVIISFNEKLSDESRIKLITETAKILEKYVEIMKLDKDKNIKINWLNKNHAKVCTKSSDEVNFYKQDVWR
jgi:hypothetical protein